jgi:hypothetical protein
MTIASSRNFKDGPVGSAVNALAQANKPNTGCKNLPTPAEHDQHNEAIPEWKKLYQSAILEMDSENLMQRIGEAERAIVERALELRKEPKAADHLKELGALAYSANFLAELRRLESARLDSTLPSSLIRHR